MIYLRIRLCHKTHPAFAITRQCWLCYIFMRGLPTIQMQFRWPPVVNWLRSVEQLDLLLALSVLSNLILIATSPKDWIEIGARHKKGVPNLHILLINYKASTLTRIAKCKEDSVIVCLLQPSHYHRFFWNLNSREWASCYFFFFFSF